MKEQIEVLINSGTSQLIIDLSNVDFIDSSGLAALVSGLKKVRALDGQLCLVGAKTNVMEVFKLTLLDKVFIFFPTVEAALENL